MREFIIDVAKCKGCGLCINACPKKALTLTGNVNKNGYTTVERDNERCIYCGICYQTCPDCVFTIRKEN